MSEGEEFISLFLQDEKIEYREEELIEKLKGDSKSYRRADFFLPRYNVYIEYFGQWNNEKEKPRYREKRQVYIRNKIPCIILYPENLGIIDFVFHKRLEYVFNRYKMETERKKYYYDLIKTDIIDKVLIGSFGLILIILNYDSQINLFDNNWLLVGLGILLFHLYKIYKYLMDINAGRNPYDPKEYEEEFE